MNPADAMLLDPRISKHIRDQFERLVDRGDVRSQIELDAYYARFAARHGPERLAETDGQALLDHLHDHSSRDSVVYWLEFKDDEEFPAIFGSIAGGSALKFGIYRRKETRRWMTGTATQQRELDVDEAIEIARSHRDQLLGAVARIRAISPLGSDEEYQALQNDLNDIAPDLVGKAWAHKYLSLIFPDRMVSYHVESYQRFYLIKMLQEPVAASGRFVNGGRYGMIARELELPMVHLAAALGSLHEKPHKYWRVGSGLSDDGEYWDEWLQGSYIAENWPLIESLAEFDYDRRSKEAIRTLIAEHYPSTPSTIARYAEALFRFSTGMAENDVFFCTRNGSTVLGIGRVAGEYYFEPGSSTPHRLPVEWLSTERWTLPKVESERYNYPFRDAQNLLQIERRVLDAAPLHIPIEYVAESRNIRALSDPIPRRIQSILDRKGQVILYGPPGTGKTYWALRAVNELSALQVKDDASVGDTRTGRDLGCVRACTFHPAYGYEEFIEGYRPRTDEGRLTFELRHGLFRNMCIDAAADPERRYFLVIDEINRGDIPSIFGELLTLLEKDKRQQEMRLPMSGEAFRVPPNVFVIGTMNTADRSIALLDTALRRRFGFIEVMPDSTVLGDTTVNGLPLGPWLDALNGRIVAHLGADARNLQIGHAYLLHGGKPVTSMERFARIVQDDLLPLLQEYCYEDVSALAKIIGSRFVDVEEQRIRHEMFEPGLHDDLISALLEPSPEIATSRQAVKAEAEALDVAEDEEDYDLSEVDAESLPNGT